MHETGRLRWYPTPTEAPSPGRDAAAPTGPVELDSLGRRGSAEVKGRTQVVGYGNRSQKEEQLLRVPALFEKRVCG